MHGHGEAKVDGSQHQGTSDDKGNALAVFVVDIAEKGRHEYGAEGSYRGEQSGNIGVDTVLHHHQFGGELQERRDG